MFAVEIRGKTFEDILPGADMAITPLSWSAVAAGGPAEATIEVIAPREALLSLLGWLRFGVKISTERGTPVWWGYVHQVDVTLRGLRIGSTLNGTCNRVQVLYSTTGATAEAVATAWAEDATSVATYGYREMIHSLGDSDATMAATKQANILARFANPQPVRALEAGQERAVLTCRGWWRTMEWRYVQRVDGRVSFLGDGGDDQVQPIGWGIVASNLVSFGGGAIHDAGGRLGALKAGHQVTVTGSTGNNATWTVAAETSEAVVSLTSTAIAFDATDDIQSASSILGDFDVDHWVKVTGSAANSKYHWLDGSGATHLTTDIAVAGSITTEAAGPSITLMQPQKLLVTGSPTYEGAAASVTIAHWGVRVGQSFVPAASMAAVAQVAVKAGKVGSPADNLTVKICSNSSGSPGTVISTGTLAASTLTTDVDWVWVTMSAVALVAGTTYWLVVERSGSVDPSNYLVTGMTTEATGTCKQWTGAAWEAMAPAWYLPHEVWATEDIGTQLANHINAAAQFVAGFDTALTAGVSSNPTMEQPATAADAIDALAGIGMSDGRRILYEVTADRIVRLFASPLAGDALNPLLVTDGGVQITDPLGSRWEPGVLPVGQWVELADLPGELAATGGLSPAFVELAGFDAYSGELQLEFGGTQDLADLLKVRQG